VLSILCCSRIVCLLQGDISRFRVNLTSTLATWVTCVKREKVDIAWKINLFMEMSSYHM
jgi:hypothetical protein